MIGIGLSDHQGIFSTRKILHDKANSHKQIKIRSLKNYTIDIFHILLSNVRFPNYKNFADVNAAYSDFISKFNVRHQ